MRNEAFIQSAVLPFAALLDRVDAAALLMGAYERAYLTHIIRNGRYYTSIYAHLLSHVCRYAGTKPAEINLVDYGAGNGLLGIFAKYCGFGKVYINDLGKGATDAAAALSKELDISIDGFITGDMESLVHYFSDKDKPDVIAGMDVIEHIYDLDLFFVLLNTINPAMLTVMSTGANADNPRKARAFARQQIMDELEGGKPGDNPLFGEATPPFIEIRASIIREAAPELAKEEILQLAKVTRGMNREDILSLLQQYQRNKVLPAALSHPTNTCDPLSGSWSERLMTVKEYEALYAKHGYRLNAYPGFYNAYSRDIKGMMKRVANGLVQLTGLRYAPFVTLVGYK
jgi:hypothetical protein